jgi:rubredoxin
MDTDFIEHMACSDCGLVYSEMLAMDSHHGSDKTCPHCGAGHGAASSLRYLYAIAQASLMRL